MTIGEALSVKPRGVHRLRTKEILGALCGTSFSATPPERHAFVIGSGCHEVHKTPGRVGARDRELWSPPLATGRCPAQRESPCRFRVVCFSLSPLFCVSSNRSQSLKQTQVEHCASAYGEARIKGSA